MDHLPLFLASKSPRRQELLRAAGIDFSVIDIDVEESYPDDMDVEAVPEFLARKKAEAAVPLLKEDQLVLAADSIVIMQGKIFGKPGDKEHAMEMIRELAGQKHLVITGVFLGDKHRGLSFQEYTDVWLAPMNQEEIEYYVDRHQPYDKAGAYGIQEWIGWSKVTRIEGSYANVMGLPVHRVYDELLHWNKNA